MKKIAAALLVLVESATAGESFLGYSPVNVHTKTQWVPIGGTVDFRAASGHLSAFHAGRGHKISEKFDGMATLTVFSPFHQVMTGRDATGAIDRRSVETTAVVVSYTIRPRLGPVFVNYGAGVGVFDQQFNYVRGAVGGEHREISTGMVGIYGIGYRHGKWSVSYDRYADLVFRNSDLGGYNQRRERRHAHALTVSRYF